MYCKHCGKEIDDTSTFCQHCGKKIEEEPISIKVQENYTTTIEKEDKKNKIFSVTIITITAIVLLIGIICSILLINGEISPKDLTENKQPPELNRETTQTLTKIIINVYCPENYKIVEVTIQLYDENDTVIGTHILQGSNYRQGNTYELIYEPTMTELYYAKSIRYSVTHYE